MYTVIGMMPTESLPENNYPNEHQTRSSMKYVSQFGLIVFALIVLAGLQYQYWLGENGRFAHKELRTEMDVQQQANDKQIAANELLRTDVHDLKTGLEAVEEHARLDLGLIKPNETFVQMTTAPTTHSSR